MNCFSRWVLISLVFLVAEGAWAKESLSFSKAVTAYQERRLDEALNYAKEAVSEEPDHVDAYALLGELYYLRQEMTKAKENWAYALKLAPSRTDVRQWMAKLDKEMEVEKSLGRSDTYPFVVRFDQDDATVDVSTLRQLLRETYRVVGQSFQYFPDHPISVILYSEANFESVKGVSHRVAGLYDGKIRLPLKPDLSRDKELKRILWHEYTHALVHDLSKNRCPTWLNEGIATLQESRVSPIDPRQFREAFQKDAAVPWKQFWDHDYETGQLELLYQQAFLTAQYLVKRGGWNGLVDLLKHLGQGYPMADALKAEYGTDAATLEKEWKAWVKRVI